jgi:hypothetical protein
VSSSPRTIVVFEAQHRWEPELQRQFIDEPVRVRGCRMWSDLLAMTLNSTKPSLPDVIVIELPEDATPCLQWLGQVSLHWRPQVPPVILICRPDAAELEWTLRDIGVREVFVGALGGEQLARCCRRMWA